MRFQKNAKTAESAGFYFDDTNVREQNEKLNEIAEKYIDVSELLKKFM